MVSFTSAKELIDGLYKEDRINIAEYNVLRDCVDEAEDYIGKLKNKNIYLISFIQCYIDEINNVVYNMKCNLKKLV